LLLLHLILVLTDMCIRYLDSVLENGAMVIKDTVILRPLVLNARGTIPAHMGCVINGNQWEFRTAATNTFDNGIIQLDAVHARGTFLRHNPQFNSNTPRFLDLKTKLASACGYITGEEFYKAIPSAYGYRGHFATCIKQVHEVFDEKSWGAWSSWRSPGIPLTVAIKATLFIPVS